MSAVKHHERRLRPLEDDHGVPRRATPLGRTAGVEDPRRAKTCDLRHMRVAVGDHVTARKCPQETRVPPGRGARVVYEADLQPFGLQDEPLGELGSQHGLVHVSLHGRHRSDQAQLFEHVRPGQVADVQDELGTIEQAQALLRQTARPPRQMRVTDERDQRKSAKKAPSR